MNLPATLAAGGGQPDPMSHVLPHAVADWFTNHHAMSLLTAVVGVGLLWVVARRMPIGGASAEQYVTRGRLTQLFETLCVFLRDEMTRPLLGKLTDRYIYLIWSIFFFVLLGNVLGLIPINAVIDQINAATGGHLPHAGGTFTGNISFTAGLAVVSLVLMFAVGIREQGAKHYFAHGWVMPLKPLWLLPVTIPIGIFVFVLELFISPVIRAFALAIRLFANMVAGHLVLASLVIMAVGAGAMGKGATSIGAAIFSFLELFVAFLQAYIFTFLTVIFISLTAVSHAEHDEHHGGLDQGEMPGEALEEGLSGTQSASAH